MEVKGKLAEPLSIGQLAERTGVAITALRFYESKALIAPTRTDAGHRRFARDALRRVSFIAAAQRVGLSLAEIGAALESLPHDRAPTAREWSRLARSWRPMLDERIRLLEKLRDDLDSCIGCGCLSLTDCALRNPEDELGADGPGPHYLLDGGAWFLGAFRDTSLGRYRSSATGRPRDSLISRGMCARSTAACSADVPRTREQNCQSFRRRDARCRRADPRRGSAAARS